MRLRIIPSYLVILFFGVFVIVRATPVNLPRTEPTLTATMTITYKNGQETLQNKALNDKIQERTVQLLKQEIPKDYHDCKIWEVYKDKVDYRFVNHYDKKPRVINFHADAVYKENGETVKTMTFDKAWMGWGNIHGEIVGNLGNFGDW
ncbi:hypothetical protein GGU10DRAFT_343172 [Lentinula aff. detonsa]|uniref:Uncharacterized protein n=1 Tax=Lentinula aff. detonsa TaxID=2804958 RepID=A0AA38NR36_9AGAR|nr:hypothetical protein GGU10DRAFT_343172 [Lentinula aff. detonsa]